MLRLFWLADGISNEEGSDPADVLPSSVLRASKKLGLNNPRLIAQTVNALSVGNRQNVKFSTNVPAILANQPVGLDCTGVIQLDGHDRTTVEMDVQVAGCRLEGSLSTPLGHYMVLGTANSMITAQRQAQPAIDPATGLPGGVPGAEFGGPAPEMGVEGAMPGDPSHLKTSRFAFVVQVIEAESFAPEE
jgi:hypothetical protein